MKYYYLFIASIVVGSCTVSEKKSGPSTDFTIGIVTDCQYCNCPENGVRYYKKSPNKLLEAVNELNKHDLDFTIHLGDFIDRDFSSFDTLIPIWDQLKSTSYHVIGNHDFSVDDHHKKEVMQKLNLKKRYYSFNEKNWKFIVLDGTDLSYYGSIDSLKLREADALYKRMKNAKKPYAQTYNGGLSKVQLDWVEQELKIASEKQLNVAFFNHFPMLPISHHNTWNTDEFLNLISKYPGVKLFMNGHNHAGSYVQSGGVHYITFKGMVDTEDRSSFSVVQFTKDSVFIKGFGREKDRRLKF